MSEAAARTQRASALEEKRRRLEDLKKRREERGNDTSRIHATANLDEYIDDLLKETTTATASSCETQVTHVSPSPTEDVNNTTLTPPINDSTGNEKQETISSSSGTTTTTATSATLRKLVETFTISTQTEDELPDDDIVEPDDEDGDERKEKIKGNKKDEANDEQPEAKEELKFLSPHEVEKEVSKQPFSMFINTASKKVERMLGTQSMLSDLLVDYVAETADRDSVLHTNSREHDDRTFVQSRQIYECHKWTPNRDVTDLDWSPIHRELLLSTYHMSAASLLGTTTAPNKGQIAVSSMLPSHDTLSASLTPRSGELLSDGLALIWSPMLPQRPEHVFTCGSPVTSGRFHPTDAALIIGGCESGQLVIWDIRSGRLPVQKSSIPTVSSMSKGHHAHAIGTMQVMDGGSSLVTTSTDGRLNFWSMANLRDPAESIQVSDSISCFVVVPESETLVLGDEHGILYTVAAPNSTNTDNNASGTSATLPPSGSSGQRVSRRQAKKFDTMEADGENLGHYGMITSISTKTAIKLPNAVTVQQRVTNSSMGSKGFLRGCGGLIVSSGVDWTVKLWAPAYHDKPLMSWLSHSYDYMSDVAWSPNHPSLFATASSNGTVGIWNLATSLDEPLTGPEGIIVEPDAMSGSGLNKLKWSADGRRIAVASSDRVHILNLSDDVVRIKGDEDTKVMNQLLSRGLIERQ